MLRQQPKHPRAKRLVSPHDHPPAADRLRRHILASGLEMTGVFGADDLPR
jgi:hypothetical protein